MVSVVFFIIILEQLVVGNICSKLVRHCDQCEAIGR